VFLGCVFSTDQGIDEIGAVQPRFLRRAPESRPRVSGLVKALAVLGQKEIGQNISQNLTF
jgi:hypothetical protein